MRLSFWQRAKMRLAAAGLALLVAAMAGILPVQAHASLVRSEPADNSVVAAAPAEIKLWFTEPVASAFSHAQLIDAGGQELALKSVHIDASDPTLMVVVPPALPDGVYTVYWQDASASDGHVARGAFAFRVGAGPAGASLAGSGPSGDPANPPVSIPEAVLRWLGYFGLLAMVGAAGMPLLVLRRPGPRASGEASLDSFFAKVASRIYVSGALAAAFVFIMGLLYLAWQVYSLAGNSPAPGGAGEALATILFTTTLGYAWLARQALTAAVGLVFLRLGRAATPLAPWLKPPGQARDADAAAAPLARETDMRRTRWSWLALALVVAVLASQAAASHAAGSRSPALPVVVDWLHLVFAGLWVGGLFALAVGILPAFRREGIEFKAVARAAWGRFGPLAAVSVGMLAATGLYSAGQRVISADALLLTGYGQALIVKVSLMLAAGLLGLANSLSLHPGLSAPLGRWLKKPPGWTPFGLLRLPQRILAEASLGVGVALLAGILTSLPPASEPQFGVSPNSQPGQMAAQVNDLYIALSIKPNRPGQNNLDILAASTSRPGTAELMNVIVRMTYIDQDLGTLSRDAVQSNPNSYHLSDDSLSQPGRWKIDVVVRRQGLPDSVASFNWTVLPLGDLQQAVISRTPWKAALSVLAGLMAALVAVVLGLVYLRPRTWWRGAMPASSRAASLDVKRKP